MIYIYILAVPSDYVYGDPQGLGHWNGHSWSWVAKFTDNPIIEMRSFFGGVQLLHREGAFSTISSGKVSKESLLPGREITVNDFVIHNGNPSVVGNDGIILTRASAGWVVNQHLSGENIISVCSSRGFLYLGCQSGNIYTATDSSAAWLVKPCDGVITSLQRLTNDTLLGTTYNYSSGIGKVFVINLDRALIDYQQDTLAGLTRAVVLSDFAFYTSSPVIGVHKWSQSIQQLSWSNTTDCPPEIHNIVAVSDRIVGYGHGNVLAVGPLVWQRMIVTLDPSYISI